MASQAQMVGHREPTEKEMKKRIKRLDADYRTFIEDCGVDLIEGLRAIHGDYPRED